MKCQRFIIDFKSYEWKYRMSIEAGKFTKIWQIKFLEKSKFSDFSASFYFEIYLSCSFAAWLHGDNRYPGLLNANSINSRSFPLGELPKPRLSSNRNYFQNS